MYSISIYFENDNNEINYHSNICPKIGEHIAVMYEKEIKYFKVLKVRHGIFAIAQKEIER